MGINREAVGPCRVISLALFELEVCRAHSPENSQAAAAGSFIHAWCGRGCCIATESTGKASIGHVDFKCFATSTFSTTAASVHTRINSMILIASCDIISSSTLNCTEREMFRHAVPLVHVLARAPSAYHVGLRSTYCKAVQRFFF